MSLSLSCYVFSLFALLCGICLTLCWVGSSQSLAKREGCFLFCFQLDYWVEYIYCAIRWLEELLEVEGRGQGVEQLRMEVSMQETGVPSSGSRLLDWINRIVWFNATSVFFLACACTSELRYTVKLICLCSLSTVPSFLLCFRCSNSKWKSAITLDHFAVFFL